MFTIGDIENFKVIYHLVKEKGFTLKGAKVEMNGLKKKMKLAPEPKMDVIESSESMMASEPETDIDPIQNDLVDKIALKNSLCKLRSSLLQLSNEIEKIDIT